MPLADPSRMGKQGTTLKRLLYCVTILLARPEALFYCTPILPHIFDLVKPGRQYAARPGEDCCPEQDRPDTSAGGEEGNHFAIFLKLTDG